MIFSSFKFLVLFFPVVLGVYLLLNKFKFDIVAKLWLIASCLYFYSQGSGSLFPFFVGTIFFNYVLGTLISTMKGEKAKRNKKILFGIALAENILLLGYFKYTDFFIQNINNIGGFDFALKGVILPIGISFFTFQLIAYIVDCYRGLTKEYSVLNYLLFITFFPQLIVGPIVHHAYITPQFADKDQGKIKRENIILAIFLFSMGCAKKLLLADPLTGFAEEYFLNVNVVGVAAFWKSWFATFSYTISYYFDLSGYADMAIGLGLFFNIKLPPNFNSPYKSRNFAEYWRKWHMTLSKFLSDYIFRSVYKKGRGSFNFYLAVMVTFFVSGFWHGAGYTFICWGLINGIFVVSSHFMERRGWKFPTALAYILTFLGIMGTRILFVSKTFDDALKVFKTMFDFSVFSKNGIAGVWNSLSTFVYGNAFILIVLAVGTGITFFAKNTTQITEGFQPKMRYAVFASIVFAVSLFYMNGVSKFLYFQF